MQGHTTMIIVAIIGFIVFFGLIAHFQTGYYLKKWLNEIRSLDPGKNEPYLSTPWIGQMVKEYEHYRVSGTPVNSQALIEKYFFKQPIRLLGLFQTPVGNVVKMVQQLPSFSIIFGVLGTFIGLTLSLFSMEQILLSLGQHASGLSVSSIVASISKPFQGMSTAFLTSVAGIGGALILTILQSGFLSRGRSISYLQAEIAAECEAFLDHDLSNHLEEQKPQDTMEKLLDRLVTKVEESFQKSIGQFGEDMTRFTAGLEEAMVDVKGILNAQRQHSEAFAESTETLQQFGQHFSETADKLDSVNSGMDRGIQKLGEHITHFEKQLGGLFKKQENNDRHMEQIIQRSDAMIEQSHRKTEELGEAFLQALNQQMQQYQDQYDMMERKIGQQQDEWYFRYQEKQDHYQRAADAFGASVGQLEKAIYDMTEKMKRDISEQINLDRERQSRMQMDRGRDDMREVTRAIESLDRDMQNIERYLEQFYQVVLRLYEDRQQKRPPARVPSQIME
ncbi:MAG TPA: hypothetical protein VFK33_16620 [Bacillales bacterium]|nr:hypothetical protein [Bacillales bacterium]